MASSKTAGDRPSFTAFLKKTKDKVRGIRHDESPGASPQGRGKAAAVSSSESPNTSSGTSPPKSKKSLSASEKAKVRRAQVRRAQIQHRQRKAEYQKELEVDITHYRELISLTEFEAGELRRQNEEIRALLASRGIVIPDCGSSGCQVVQRPAGLGDAWVDEILGTSGSDSGGLNQSEGDMFADVNVDDIIVTLKKDEGMDTPFFSIRSNSASSNATSPPSPEADAGLSQEEEQMVVNFILSLEHICWDHFFLGDFPSHSYLGDEEAKGHTLMASSLCMAHAPQHVFLDRKLVSSATPCHNRRSLGLDPVVPAVSFEWSSPAISLSSLHGLARSLNPGDQELTPIQAWFELSRRYEKSVLLDFATLELLSKELNGVVKCLEFGAVMEREAFESVIGRVLGEGLEDAMAGVALSQPDNQQQPQGPENPFGFVGYAWT